MKKVIFVMLTILLITGSGKKENVYSDYTMYYTASNSCEFKQIYEDDNYIVKTYCLDNVNIKNSKEKEIALEEVLSKDNVVIEQLIDGYAIKDKIKLEEALKSVSSKSDIQNNIDLYFKGAKKTDELLVLKKIDNETNVVIMCPKGEKQKIVLTSIPEFDIFMCMY